LNKAAIWTVVGLALFQVGCAVPSSQAALSGATALSPGGSSESTRIFPNGNSCAPDVAEPAWGPGNGLLGYRCVRVNGNG
jgi:hypothetical protein